MQAASAVATSLVVVPLLTAASLVKLVKHDASQIDWLLLELMVALECIESGRSRVQKIFAVVTAARRQLKRLPKTVPTATIEAAVQELRRFGVEPSGRLAKCTVKSIVDEVCAMVFMDACKNQGGGGGGTDRPPIKNPLLKQEVVD